jgi:hypothetical protein
MCEPLHDMKNVIAVIFEELHWQIDNEALRKSMKEFCAAYTGKILRDLILNQCNAL